MIKYLCILIIVFFQYISSDPEFVKQMGCNTDWVTIVRTEDFSIIPICGDPFNCHIGYCYQGQVFEYDGD